VHPEVGIYLSRAFVALGSFWARLYHLFGIPSEGDKRDSKQGLARPDFAPEPASRTRPRGIFGLPRHW
jgi:hypothetical protein